MIRPFCFEGLAKEHGRYNETAMLTEEHTQTTQQFLQQADAEFAAGDNLQGSEKMWAAAAHAVMALAQDRGWPFGSHRSLKIAADRLAEQYDDPGISDGFLAAQQFHANFYHDFMEEDDLERGRESVRRFVARLLALPG